jgi:DNA-binding Lrp family transcriptional regulator
VGDAVSAINSLDAIDRTIIGLLQEDGRRSNAGISRLVLAVVDPSAAGHGQHLFFGINVKPGRVSAVCDALVDLHEVSFLAHLVGRYDVLIEVFAADTEDVLDFMSEGLAGIDDIVSMESFSVLRNQKVSYYNWNLPVEAPGTSRK